MESFPYLDTFSYLSLFLYTLYYLQLPGRIDKQSIVQSPPSYRLVSIWFRCAFTLSPSLYPRPSPILVDFVVLPLVLRPHSRFHRIPLALVSICVIRSYPPSSTSILISRPSSKYLDLRRNLNIPRRTPRTLIESYSRQSPIFELVLRRTGPPRTLPLACVIPSGLILVCFGWVSWQSTINGIPCGDRSEVRRGIEKNLASTFKKLRPSLVTMF